MNLDKEYSRRRDYNMVTTAELKSLIFRVKSFRDDVSIRFRLQGHLWMPNFLEVVITKQAEAIFRDRSTGELIYVKDINEVMQFELDTAFEGYEPHNHYDVDALTLMTTI
jgi:hypothetical protein